MDKIKQKVIGVLRERDGGTNVNRTTSGGHQVGVAVAIGVTHTQDNAGGDGNAPGAAGTERNDTLAVGAGGAARTTALPRPQTSKISALDLAGILNTRRRLEWTKEWLRKNQTEFLSKENLLSELQSRKDECYHLNYFLTITENQFRYLVQKLEPIISQYAPQRKKKSFSAEERLAITLKYLATGEVHSCRNYCFRASKFVINEMIANICLGFYEILKDQYVQLLKTDEQWRKAATDMERKHKLPQCVGNLFMRSIQLQSNGTGSASDDRKRSAVIFTGIVDAENNFQYVDVECASNSRPNDIYNQTTAVQIIKKKIDDMEEAADLHCQGYYFVGDALLPAQTYLVTTRDMPECAAFDLLDQVNAHAEQTMRILCNLFPILAQPLRISDKHVCAVILGCVALYNFLRKTDESFRRNSDSIVHQQRDHQQQQMAYVNTDEIDDDCIMLATDEELRELAEFTPSVGLTTCFQPLCAQRGETPSGLAKRDVLLKMPFASTRAHNGGLY